MSKKKTKTKTKLNSGKKSEAAMMQALADQRSVQTIVIVWTLTILTTFLCNLGIIVGSWLTYLFPEHLGLAVFADLMGFAALVFGIGSILLTFPALRYAPAKPPTIVTVAALVMGSIPILLFLSRILFPVES